MNDLISIYEMNKILTLGKVRVESWMYERGLRWIEYMESETDIDRYESNRMVLDYKHSISIISIRKA